MCHSHSKRHPCAHTSMSWYYCPNARLDMSTGAVSPCARVTMAKDLESRSACPLQHCRYQSKGRRWVCCQCGRGPNDRGWCAQRVVVGGGVPAEELQLTCDHGCCERCKRYDDYDYHASPSAWSSDGANTWVTSPASSKAGSGSGSESGSRSKSGSGAERSSKRAQGSSRSKTSRR